MCDRAAGRLEARGAGGGAGGKRVRLRAGVLTRAGLTHSLQEQLLHLLVPEGVSVPGDERARPAVVKKPDAGIQV